MPVSISIQLATSGVAATPAGLAVTALVVKTLAKVRLPEVAVSASPIMLSSEAEPVPRLSMAPPP